MGAPLPPFGAAPIFVAGPCVIETPEALFEIAGALAAMDEAIVFKASFDKANRSSGRAFRGPGLRAGLALLAEVGARFGLPLLTDVHEPAQCDLAAEVVDVLQIPALLCRQTDLVQAAARTGRVVNIKRGPFLDPRRMSLLVDKARDAGAAEVWVTERGSAFGHGDLVLDPRALVWLRESGAPVIYDCTHTAQSGTEGAATGGRRAMIRPLARAAAAVGVSGFYCEVHPAPAQARCDAATQLTPASFVELAREVRRLSTLVERPHSRSE